MQDNLQAKRDRVRRILDRLQDAGVESVAIEQTKHKLPARAEVRAWRDATGENWLSVAADLEAATVALAEQIGLDPGDGRSGERT